ncbi:MAG TPA: response regulator, partial [Pyrinomonadaceae bacterium]|nr:response regulator [Pyrinomonadaceae bacterium]
MTRTPTILIVDDNEQYCRSLKRRLEQENKYRVLTANTAQEALDLSEQESINCIGLDVKLSDAPNDRSGFELARKLGKIPKFFLTLLDDGDSTIEGNSVEMRDANVVKYVFKRHGPAAVLKAIEEIVTSLHLDLTIHWGTDTPLGIVENLKHFRGRSDAEKRVLADELVSLLCTAFKSAKEITILEIKRGKGGCVVAQIRPHLQFGGAPVMVKLGPRATIMEEHQNYADWAGPYLQGETTRVVKEPAQTLHLAAIEYSFVGGSNPKPFNTFFGQSSAPEVERLLSHLFGRTCEKWYEARTMPDPQRSLPLDQIYRSRQSLNLSEKKHVPKLDELVEKLLSSQSYAPYVKVNGASTIEVRLGSVVEKLPNPLTYAFRERWKNGFNVELFPSPLVLVITHGDLNGENIVVNEHGRGFLIDFYKTGLGPTCRDFVELESIIKFELLQMPNLAQRYQLELDLLAPLNLSDPIRVGDSFANDPEVLKVINTVQQLRRRAALVSNSDDPTEYYIGLMFNALREILGFSSGHDDGSCCQPRQFYAFLSAAKICQWLLRKQTKPVGPDSPPLIFLSYASEDLADVNAMYTRLSQEGYKPWMASV